MLALLCYYLVLSFLTESKSLRCKYVSISNGLFLFGVAVPFVRLSLSHVPGELLL